MKKEANHEGLGWRQKFFLDYMNEFIAEHGDAERKFSIPRDETKTALSLEKRGLIRIVNKDFLCWLVVLAG